MLRKRRGDGKETDVPLSEIKVGDLLRVRPDEKVPTDGAVTEGRSSVDESMVSGEPIPVEKTVDAKLVGGTMKTGRQRGRKLTQLLFDPVNHVEGVIPCRITTMPPTVQSS